MSSTDHLRRGACPTAGSPLESGDGLISRVRLPAGYLKAKVLAWLADAAELHGGGVLELTSRGNLQIRGLDSDGEQALARTLVAEGLTARHPDTEAVRNVHANPAADLDPCALVDPAPPARHLDALIRRDPVFRALPSKFRVVLNGGGLTHLAKAHADIRADAVPGHGQPVYRLALAGTAFRARYLGVCGPARVSAHLSTLMKTLIRLDQQRGDSVGRMADGLASFGEAPFREAVGLDAAPDPGVADVPDVVAPGPSPLGLVVGVPFGRLDAGTARKLADLAGECGQNEIRVTPWRQLVLPGLTGDDLGRLKTLDLITRTDDPRHALVACPGAPGCASGSSPTRTHALEWARAVPELFDGTTLVHVSGCEKACARPDPAPVTITARNGRYEIVLHDRACPQRSERRVAENLGAEEVPLALRHLVARAWRAGTPGDSLSDALLRLV